MINQRIVTLAAINVRKGPGIFYDEVESVKADMAFTATEFKKDANNIGWYKIDKGWVCAKYVSLASDIKAGIDKTSKKGGPRSTGGELAGITSAIVSTGESTLSKQISKAESPLGDSNGSGSLTAPDDSMEDMFLSKRAYGLPYQFRDTVDMRMGNDPDNILGIGYREAMTQFPMISFLPGRPSFLPDLDEDQKKQYLEAFSSTVLNPLSGNTLNTFLQDAGVDMKFFTFEPDYVSYIRYVNTLCWIFAIYLRIGDGTIPGESDSSWIGDVMQSIDSTYNSSSFRNYHYGDYRLANYFAGRDNMGSNGKYKYDKMSEASSGKHKIFKDNPESDNPPADEQTGNLWDVLCDTMDLDEYYTEFYINPNISYSETFSNSTKPSMMAGLVNGFSELSKELAFLVSSGAAMDISDDQQALKKSLDELASRLTGGGGLIQRMLSGVTTIISGSNLLFPEIWTGSNFSRSFNIDITLRTPYGNRESIFTDILVPMAHWICLAAPRQTSINSYGAPFLIKFHIPGFCSVDLGIVDSLTITKGGDGSAWSVDGLPLEVQLSIAIKDLYSSLSISRLNGVSLTDAYNTLWNHAYLDYAAIQTGIDLKQAMHRRKLDLAISLAENETEDLLSGGRLIEEARQILGNRLSGVSNSMGGTIGRAVGNVLSRF